MFPPVYLDIYTYPYYHYTIFNTLRQAFYITIVLQTYFNLITK